MEKERMLAVMKCLELAYNEVRDRGKSEIKIEEVISLAEQYGKSIKLTSHECEAIFWMHVGSVFFGEGYKRDTTKVQGKKKDKPTFEMPTIDECEKQVRHIWNEEHVPAEVLQAIEILHDFISNKLR